MAKKKKEVITNEVEPNVDVNTNLEGTETAPENWDKKEETVSGKVIGCTALNIRKGPSLSDDILGRVNAGAEVIVDIDNSTSDWYKVTTSGSITGFCMRKHIAIIR